jgi:hypothetical protein
MSNIGGTATMVGDPPNIIIGNALHKSIGFMDFIIHLGPGGGGCPERARAAAPLRSRPWRALICMFPVD